MIGDSLLNTILTARFNGKWDDPSQFWFSGLIEGLIYKGEERYLSTRFLPLLSPPSRPYSETRQLSATIRPSDQEFNIRVWNLLHAGLLHQAGVALHRYNQVLFPRTEFVLETPFNTNFFKFKDCEYYGELKKILHPKEQGDNIYLIQFDQVKTPNGTFDHVIIPCAEIARFYFFNSSNIIEPLLQPGSLNKSSNKFFNAERSGIKYDLSNQPFHVLILGTAMTRTDAAIIARIAFSDTAASAASILNASCLEKVNGRSFIKCPFPFEDSTTLNANCITIEAKGKRILFVMELLTCTAPFPFDFLAVGFDNPETNDNSNSPGGTNSKPKNNNERKKKTPLVDINTPAENNDQFGGSFDTHDLSVFNFKERFISLSTKNILKLKSDALAKEKPGGKAVRLIKTISINSKKNGGPGSARISSKTKETKKPAVRKYTVEEIEKEDQKLKVDRFEMMYLIKEQFEKKGATVYFHKWIKVSDSSDFTYFYEDVMNTESRWPFLDYAEGKLRRGLCLCVMSSDHAFYILDTEVKPKEDSSVKLFARKDFKELDIGDSEKVLNCLLENGGRLVKLFNGSNKSLLSEQFSVSRLYHYSSWSSQKYADFILRLLSIV